MPKIVKEHIGFHYSLIELQLYTLILLEFNIFLKKIKIRDKSVTSNIFRIQDHKSIMCAFYCNAFIEYVLAGKTFLDYTNLFSPNDYKRNEKIIYTYIYIYICVCVCVCVCTVFIQAILMSVTLHKKLSFTIEF